MPRIHRARSKNAPGLRDPRRAQEARPSEGRVHVDAAHARVAAVPGTRRATTGRAGGTSTGSARTSTPSSRTRTLWTYLRRVLPGLPRLPVRDRRVRGVGQRLRRGFTAGSTRGHATQERQGAPLLPQRRSGERVQPPALPGAKRALRSILNRRRYAFARDKYGQPAGHARPDRRERRQLGVQGPPHNHQRRWRWREPVGRTGRLLHRAEETKPCADLRPAVGVDLRGIGPAGRVRQINQRR